MFKLMNGDPAPDFTLTSATGEPWTLSAHRGKLVCLYFGRGEYCPTTRGEFAHFNSFNHIFRKMNCHFAFLVNGGRAEHERCAREYRMRIPILIDEGGVVGETYGVYGVNHNDLKRQDYKNYIAPATYIIDVEGKVAAFWISSAPRGLPSPECILGILGYAEHNGGKY
jgi:peroxiredoxin